jgi:excisionase family DNA binding protein
MTEIPTGVTSAVLNNSVPSSPESARKWLNTVQAADYAQCSTKTLYRAVAAGKLKAARIGRDLRFTTEWLDAWLVSTVDR